MTTKIEKLAREMTDRECGIVVQARIKKPLHDAIMRAKIERQGRVRIEDLVAEALVAAYMPD